jgi:hypothetical protein
MMAKIASADAASLTRAAVGSASAAAESQDSVEAPYYDTCTRCDDAISPSQRDLIEVAITTNDTKILGAVLGKLRSPFSLNDRRVLDEAFVGEMLKGPLCSAERIWPLASRGGTIPMSTLKYRADDVGFCNTAFRLGVIPYYMSQAQFNGEPFLAFLMLMQDGLVKAARNWSNGQFEVFNGKDHSDFEDEDKVEYYVDRFKHLVLTTMDVIALANKYEATYHTDQVGRVLETVTELRKFQSIIGIIVLRARDKWHPHDNRTRIYTRLAAALDKAYESAKSNFEEESHPRTNAPSSSRQSETYVGAR